MVLNPRFTEGDFIEVSPGDGETDFGVVRGTALDSRNQVGWADFKMAVNVGGGRTVEMHFNLNHVHVTNLFKADHARSM
jgi:hypothetical protein